MNIWINKVYIYPFLVLMLFSFITNGETVIATKDFPQGNRIKQLLDLTANSGGRHHRWRPEAVGS